MKQLFFKDVILDCSIGIHHFEKEKKQSIKIDLILDMEDEDIEEDKLYDDMLNYDDILNGIEHIVQSQHFELQETLLHKITVFCLSFKDVHHADVSICKPDIYSNCGAVGFRVTKSKL